MKSRAKEMVVEKSVAAKDRFLGSPIALGIAGGLATMGIASLIQRRRNRQVDRVAEYFDDLDVGDVSGMAGVGVSDEGMPASQAGTYVQAPPGSDTYAAPPPGTSGVAFEDEERGKLGAMKEKASAFAGEAKEKASAFAGEARERARDLGHRASDAACAATRGVKHAAQGAGRKLESSAHEWPILFAAGAAAAGAILALMLPVSEKERELLEPVRRRTRSQIDTLRDRVDEELDTLQEKLDQKLDSV
jgi:hypothetical protein